MALKAAETECNNGKTESSGDGLLSPTKNLSIHSGNTEMLFNSGHLRFKKEPISEEVCIGDTNQRPGQCWECSKNRLEKVRIPCVITSPDSSDSENLPTRVQKPFLLSKNGKDKYDRL
jgi:hypothetical protein